MDGEIRPDRHAHICKTLEEARGFIPPGLIRMPRFDCDDPIVFETYF